MGILVVLLALASFAPLGYVWWVVDRRPREEAAVTFGATESRELLNQRVYEYANG